MRFLGFSVGILFRLVDGILWLYIWVVIVRAVMSWLQPNPYNPIVVTLRRLTDPPLQIINRYIPTRRIGIDLSPMILIMAIWIVQSLLNFTYATYVIPLFK